MTENRRVIVIGGGAAGFTAAITAARAGAAVTILEHGNVTCRKIEKTGNGRCNLTNLNQEPGHYRGGDESLIQSVLERFDFHDTLRFFREMGLEFRERDGYYYPLSNQAVAVSYVLRSEAVRLRVKIACNVEVLSIQRDGEEFLIRTKGYDYRCDSVILATGSMADPSTGSDGSGYRLAEAAGHRIIGPYPALVYLKSRDRQLGTLAGLRAYGRVRLVVDGMTYAERGEIQFVKNGISGIPVFQLSRYASRGLAEECDELRLFVDFLPTISQEDAWDYFMKRRKSNHYKNLSGFLTGLVHEKVISVVASMTGIKGNVLTGDLADEQWRQVIDLLKNQQFTITDTGGFEAAQVCCGGVSLDEVDSDLQSRLVEGLYFAGEILDVDGACGGYNLQWAWSSGSVAGRAASRGKRMIAED